MRIPYVLLLGVTLFTILWSIYEYLFGPDRAVPWLTEADFTSIPVIIDQFSKLARNFDVQASGYLITERFGVGWPVLSATVAYLYLGLLAVAAIYFLAAVTTLKRIPYAIGMLLFMLLIASMNTDALGIIQETRNYFLIAVIIAFGLLTYYFQAFALHINFTFRLLFLLLLTLLVASVIYLRSSYDIYTTSLHLIGHSSSAVLLAGLLFVFLVAFDNIQGLLWLNGQGTTPQQRAGAGRFVLVTVLYLASLTFIYLAQTGFFQVDVSVITPFFLLVVSFLIGLWGFRQRAKIMERFLPFATAGAFIYLSLGICAFLGAAYAFGTANDPVIEAFNDAVLYTHIAFGVLFFIYIMVNFGPAIHKRLPVYRVAYNAQRIPFFTVYAAGTILLAILVLRTSWISLNQARAGYYNYLGDLYHNEGNDLLAERYYHEGHVYENNNVRSNMNLAMLAAEKNYRNSEIIFIKRTLQKRPEEKMFVRLANLYNLQGNLFDSMFTTREGLKKFPRSYRLHNNMALLFSKTDMLDSVNFYLAKAHDLAKDPVLKTNTLALQLKNGATDKALAYIAENKDEKHTTFNSNVALVQMMTPEAADAKKVPATGQLVFNDGSFMLYYHQLLGALPQADTTTVTALNLLLSEEQNQPYYENLNLLKALVLYYHSYRTEARKTLEMLTLNYPANDGYYLNLTGLWLMEGNMYRSAADYFSDAKEAGYAPAFLNHAYALGLAGETAKAGNEAVRVMTSGDPELIRQAMDLQNLLQTAPNNITATTNDTLKAQLLQLYSRQLPAELQLGVLNNMQNPRLQAEGKAQVIKELINAGRTDEAAALLDQMQQQKLDQALAAGQWQRLQASVLLAQKQYQQLLSALDKTNFGFGYETLKNYYRAVCLWRLGKPAEAKVYFDELPKQVPYYPEAILATAQFYTQQQNKPMKAYDLLLSALAYNPYSVPVLKAYILKAVDINLAEYADYSLQKLQELVPPIEYSTFKIQYEQAVANKEATADQW